LHVVPSSPPLPLCYTRSLIAPIPPPCSSDASQRVALLPSLNAWPLVTEESGKEWNRGRKEETWKLRANRWTNDTDSRPFRTLESLHWSLASVSERVHGLETRRNSALDRPITRQRPYSLPHFPLQPMTRRNAFDTDSY